MTQRNIDIMDAIVDKMIEGETLSQALKSVYRKRQVLIPYNEEIFGVSLMDLKMSCRTTNALLRTGLRTLGDVVNYCKTHKIIDISNLGKSSGIEVFETILDYCWAHMTIKERTTFLMDTVERNTLNIRA